MIIRSVEHKVYAGFALALLILALVGFVSRKSAERLSEATEGVRHVREVLMALVDLLSTVTDAETAQRGYTITGSESFLGPYSQAQENAPRLLRRLRSLTADNSRRQRQLEALTPILNAQLELSKVVVEFRRSEGFEAARDATVRGQGNAWHEQLRKMVVEMEAEEKESLAERIRQREAMTRTTQRVVHFGSVLAIAFVGVALIPVRRELIARRRAEADLQDAQKALEGRVKERTAELTKSNRSLEVISRCNEAALHATEELDLLRQVCRIMVETGGYASARAGGIEEGMGLDEMVQGAPAAKFVAPLECGDKIMGELTVCSNGNDSFDAGEKRCLMVVAGNIGFGLAALRESAARAQLEERALRWQHVFESTQFGLACASLTDSTFLDVNPTFASQRGYARDELIGQPLSLVYAPEAAPAMKERLPVVARTGHLVFESVHQRKDGSCFPVLMEVARVVDANGRALSLVAYALDLTQHKRAEASLEQAEKRLRLALDAARIGSFDWDLASGVIAWSRWHECLWGFAPGEFDGKVKTFESRVHPEDLASLNAELARCEISGEQYVHEYRVCWPDGSVHWISATGGFEYDNAGKAVRMRGVVRDITSGKEAEQALQASEGRFRSTMDRILEGCQIIGFDGRYLYINDAAARQNCRPKEDLIGQKVAEMWPGIDQTAVYAAERRCLEERLPSRFENEFVFPDGHRGWFDLSVEPMPEGIVILSIDITERKRAEDELKASLAQRIEAEDALRRRNEELVRFSYTVSHDLKSPLVTIQTFLGYLEKDMQDGNAAQVKADLAYIGLAARKMSELLEELLELSRAGRKTNSPEEVTLQSLAQEATNLVAGAIAARRVQVKVTDIPVVLFGDRGRLLEVYQNLIENAVKFMGQQPAPCIEVGANLDAAETVLFVRDNGLGFDPRHQGKLFGLFEKLHPETPGSGIGLALVQRIVEVHGGRVWAESAGLGKGATFYFTLSHTKRS